MHSQLAPGPPPSTHKSICNGSEYVIADVQVHFVATVAVRSMVTLDKELLFMETIESQFNAQKEYVHWMKLKIQISIQSGASWPVLFNFYYLSRKPQMGLHWPPLEMERRGCPIDPCLGEPEKSGQEISL